jgi:hypothetical protein
VYEFALLFSIDVARSLQLFLQKGLYFDLEVGLGPYLLDDQFGSFL